MAILDKISKPSDVKLLKTEELTELCTEIRSFLINNISKNGGHLASNLGVVELTVAMARIFDLPDDKIIWDVGHQSYVYKILTGRRESFSTLRTKGGISGFPSPTESEYDAFIGGHSSTSVSAALGIARANVLNKINSKAIAVIGDGALTGGMAFEGLNNAGRSKTGIIVVLNDNEMSISKNVGGMSRYLSKIRSKPFYFSMKDIVFDVLKSLPLGTKIIRAIMESKKALKEVLYHSTMFEEMGFAYLGPVDGHDIKTLCQVFTRAKELKLPTFIHINTVKGKGYSFAEDNPCGYHGVSKFNVQDGVNPKHAEDFSYIIGKCLCELAEKDEKICTVTAAMASGTGLTQFEELYPKRFFDVGIAEQHAVTFAAGLSAGGLLPVFVVYSSFLQRAYDQLIHDIALESQKVVICIDRAGITGEDGKTHQGIYDSAFLNTIPGFTVMAPASYSEAECMLKAALYDFPGPVAIRYPKGVQTNETDMIFLSPYTLTENGGKILLVTYGRQYHRVKKAAELLKEKGIIADILKLNIIKPITCPDISRYSKVFFFEEGILSGGINESFAKFCSGKYYVWGTKDILPHATVEELIIDCGLDENSISEYVGRISLD